MKKMGGTSCCADGCSNNYSKNRGVSFFHFPKDANLRRQWEVALRKKSWKPTASSRVCSDHFSAEMFELRNRLLAEFSLSKRRRWLKPGAVPSLFAGRPGPMVLLRGAYRKRRRRELVDEAFKEFDAGAVQSVTDGGTARELEGEPERDDNDPPVPVLSLDDEQPCLLLLQRAATLQLADSSSTHTYSAGVRPAYCIRACDVLWPVNTAESSTQTVTEKRSIGKLFVTNLRIIWLSHARPRVNLSVGFNCVTGVSSRTVNSKLRGVAEALYLLTKTSSSRYEFIFTNLQVSGTPKLIASVVNVFRAYNSSKPYRELRLRAALLQRGQLLVLPAERICNRVQGVWNLSSDQGNLGTLYVSNVRLVWHANMNDSFNISLPYIQMTSIKKRESKFGTALVIETTEKSGGYVLGFKVDPAERLQDVFQELSSLYQVHRASPVLGVNFYTEQHRQEELHLDSQDKPIYGSVHRPEDGPAMADDEQEVSTENHYDAFAAYISEGSHVPCRQVVYNADLGLATEKLKDGYSLASLWEVVPP